MDIGWGSFLGRLLPNTMSYRPRWWEQFYTWLGSTWLTQQFPQIRCVFYISTFIYTSGPGISVYCDSANNTSYDLKSVAYTNNGSNGPYLSIVAPKISVSFCYNEKKTISIDCKEQCLILQHDYIQNKLNPVLFSNNYHVKEISVHKIRKNPVIKIIANKPKPKLHQYIKHN